MNQNVERLLVAYARTKPATIVDSMREFGLKAGESWLTSPNPRYVHFVRSGLVSHSIGDANGATIAVNTSIAGDLIELHELAQVDHQPCRMKVILPAQVVRVPFSLVQRTLMDDALFRSELVLAMGRRCLRAEQVSACNASHPLDARLARYISYLSRLSNGPLPVTHGTLAEELGVRRSSVSLAVGSFLERGILRSTRGSITVLDRNALFGFACACSSSMKPVEDQPRLYSHN